MLVTESCPVPGLPALQTLSGGGSVLAVTSKVWAQLNIPHPHPQGMEPGYLSPSTPLQADSLLTEPLGTPIVKAVLATNQTWDNCLERS